MTGGKKYIRAKKKVENYIEQKDLPELESSLKGFESLLVTDPLKRKEKPFVDKAHEEKDYLAGVEGVAFLFSK